MADKPARALVIYGDGLLPAVGPQHNHLHDLAASASCGFLALRTLPPSVTSEDERLVTELAQLIDVYDNYTEKARKDDSSEIAETESGEDGSLPCVSDRFMGMKASFITNSKPASALGKQAGFSVTPLAEYGANKHTSLPNANTTASKALSLLGFEESGDATDGVASNELVFLHLDAKSGLSAETGAEFLDSLVGCVQDLSKEGTKAYGHLFLAVVLGYGDAKSSGPGIPSLRQETELPATLAGLRPRQSYTLKAGKPVEGIREEYPLLAAYNQVAVTRRDEVTAFTFEDFQKRAGNLTILADRFLYEVAFKLWKAPKYGA